MRKRINAVFFCASLFCVEAPTIQRQLFVFYDPPHVKAPKGPMAGGAEVLDGGQMKPPSPDVIVP